MLDVCLLGCGGMMPLPKRYLTALMVRYMGSSLLIDCGEGTQVTIREKGWSVNPVDMICFTHYHGDHISGLPGLLLSMGNSDRTEPLKLVGPRGLEKYVRSLMVIAPELPFEIEFMELTENEHTITSHGMIIEAFKVNHGITCYGYSISIPRKGMFDVARANEAQIPVKYWNALQNGNEVVCDDKVFTPDMVLGPPRKGIKLTYCTDTRPVPVIAEKASGSDLFICEGMYGEEDKLSNAKEKKHMTFYEAAELAKKAEAKEMWLTHYSPSLINPEQYMDKVRKIFPGAKPGKDRKSITLEFED
ncbi:MAG: ribonuclease Z [Lachnospiraceae bacterium]|nr:ribonuclease Z [Lachnospiraceae bacterium]